MNNGVIFCLIVISLLCVVMLIAKQKQRKYRKEKQESPKTPVVAPEQTNGIVYRIVCSIETDWEPEVTPHDVNEIIYNRVMSPTDDGKLVIDLKWKKGAEAFNFRATMGQFTLASTKKLLKEAKRFYHVMEELKEVDVLRVVDLKMAGFAYIYSNKLYNNLMMFFCESAPSLLPVAEDILNAYKNNSIHEHMDVPKLLNLMDISLLDHVVVRLKDCHIDQEAFNIVQDENSEFPLSLIHTPSQTNKGVICVGVYLLSYTSPPKLIVDSQGKILNDFVATPIDNMNYFKDLSTYVERVVEQAIRRTETTIPKIKLY